MVKPPVFFLSNPGSSIVAQIQLPDLETASLYSFGMSDGMCFFRLLFPGDTKTSTLLRWQTSLLDAVMREGLYIETSYREFEYDSKLIVFNARIAVEPLLKIRETASESE